MNAKIRIRRSKCQSGYALLLMVVGLLGVGGLVAAGYTQEAKVRAEEERYLHNQRVLQDAKRALLQYAYNYPKIAGAGPGRLPCPDTDNSGTSNAVPGCDGVAGVIGRLPWNTPELNLSELRDASGERLWLAVSNNFANSSAALSINSDTQGTITIEDRSGVLIYDGTAATGVAAVIIAPGDPIERGGVQQTRTGAFNDPTRLDPANYLDLFGVIDNADYTNNDPNGFVVGPIEDVLTGDLLVNDQMIIITADEVIAMAEKATLQAYREAIDVYLANTGNEYPWLFNYDVATVAELTTLYPGDDDPLAVAPPETDNFGRIPAIFGPYFEDGDSQNFQTTIYGTLNIDFGSLGAVSRTGGDTSPFSFNPITESVDFPINGLFTDARFESAGNGRLVGTMPAAQIFTRVLYFWDEDDPDAPFQPTGLWSLCPAGADDESDCWRDVALNPTPGGSNDSREEILRVEIQISFPAGLLTLTQNAVPTSINYDPATAVSHARITATYNASDLDIAVDANPVISVTYQRDQHNHEGEAFAIEELGDITVADLLGGASTFEVTIDYFPEIPAWAETNGWHDAIRMAYADDHRPGVVGDCDLGSDDCLKLLDSPGSPRDKVSMLVIGGEHGWAGPPFNTTDVFDIGNHDDNTTFFTHRGNDRLLLIEELP